MDPTNQAQPSPEGITRSQLEKTLVHALATSDRKLSAQIWREAIWAMAHAFSDGQCEMTHSEISISDDNQIESLALCLQLPVGTFPDFADFIEKQIHLVPTSYYEISVFIGFNYSNPGVITISAGKVSYSAEQDFLDIPSDGKLGYGNTIEEREIEESVSNVVFKYILSHATCQAILTNAHFSEREVGVEKTDIAQWWELNGYTGVADFIHKFGLGDLFEDNFGRPIEEYLAAYPELKDGLSLYNDLVNLDSRVPRLSPLDHENVHTEGANQKFLRYRSIGVTQDEYHDGLVDAVLRENIKQGSSYVGIFRLGDTNRDCFACDLKILDIADVYIETYNPGREERSEYYFNSYSNGKEITYGSDWYLLERDSRLAKILQDRT